MLHLAYIRALSEKGDETAVLEEWAQTVEKFQEEAKNRLSLETLAWGVLSKGEHSSQLGIRLNALLGAAFTRDVRALSLIIAEMRGTNAMLRSMAIKLATMYGDGPLQVELARLLKEERVWYVRLEVIRAIGQLRMIHLREELKEIIGHSKTLVEEKATAILALVSMYDAIGPEELRSLSRSNRAGLRQLSCELVAHLDLGEYADEMVFLLKDSSPDVRMEAIYTLGLLRVPVEAKQLTALLYDSSPPVSITAAWYALLFDDAEAEVVFAKWLESSYFEWRKLASAALAVTGKKGIGLATREMLRSPDPYVRANLALGLIGQREHVKLACKTLERAYRNEKNSLWMWDDHLLFRSLSPTTLSHIDQIPNYPQVVDQMTRLDILSVLSVMRYAKAQEMVKGFLKNESWGVTGAAAATLLEEGDAEAMDLVRSLLTEKDQKVRVQAALILALFGSDPAAVKVLQESYAGASRELKVHILEALGRIGDPQSSPFLMDVLKEPFQMMRVVAASALIQCLYH